MGIVLRLIVAFGTVLRKSNGFLSGDGQNKPNKVNMALQPSLSYSTSELEAEQMVACIVPSRMELHPTAPAMPTIIQASILCSKFVTEKR